MQTTNEQNITPKKAKAPFTKGVLEQLELVVVFFAIVILLFSFVCKTCMVDGDSMLNTLHDQERVIIWDLFYTPQYEDIVVIHDNGNLKKPIVKRVIGLPGDTVEIEQLPTTMKVTVTHSDGTSRVLEENYIYYDTSRYYYLNETYVVGEGQVFVMGDNRLNSLDSRAEGCYDSRQILGKVVFRMLPLDKIGTVE